MFGLGTADGRAELRRHRLFETSFDCLLAPPCNHRTYACGVYGDGNGRYYRRTPRTVGVYGHAGGSSAREKAQQFLTRERGEAMGIDWMTGNELSQAIPPDYSEFIARAFLASGGAK
jgi:DNA (cytosine-5)-methyltransferase 1